MNSINKANIDAVMKVAVALGEINDHAAYVGGAVISLYANDPAADEPRPTKDVDITLEIASFAELTKLQADLYATGFQPDIKSGITCRFIYEGILVDIMATQEVGWAPANPWFKQGFEHLLNVKLDNDIQICILSLPFYLASKFEAHKDRGKDPRTSHDFEDIIYVLDNSVNLVNDICTAPLSVFDYLRKEFQKILNPDMEEAVLSHLNQNNQLVRWNLMNEKLETIITYQA